MPGVFSLFIFLSSAGTGELYHKIKKAQSFLQTLHKPTSFIFVYLIQRDFLMTTVVQYFDIDKKDNYELDD